MELIPGVTRPKFARLVIRDAFCVRLWPLSDHRLHKTSAIGMKLVTHTWPGASLQAQSLKIIRRIDIVKGRCAVQLDIFNQPLSGLDRDQAIEALVCRQIQYRSR